MNRFRHLVLVALSITLLGLASCQSDHAVRPDDDQALNATSKIPGATSLVVDAQMFKGPAVPVGNGVARTWVAIGEDGTPVAIGVDLSEKALENLPDHVTQQVLQFHPAVEHAPWNHVLFDFNPEGHEPPGVYDLEHFDIHFYMISSEERSMIGLDDPEHDIEPDPIYIPSDYMKIPGGVPQMGAHWVDLQAPEFNGGTFSKTFIWGSYDGEVIFEEPMITTDLIANGPHDSVPVRQPDAYQRDGYYPTSYGVERLSGHRGYRIYMTGLAWQDGQ